MDASDDDFDTEDEADQAMSRATEDGTESLESELTMAAIRYDKAKLEPRELS